MYLKVSMKSVIASNINLFEALNEFSQDDGEMIEESEQNIELLTIEKFKKWL